MTPHWGAPGESGWIIRQVAGALAWVADVDVVTPDGRSPGTALDAVFRIHRLGTPLRPTAELRRDVLVDIVHGADPAPGTTPSQEFQSETDRDLLEPWAAAADALASIRPDLVVIAGHRSIGALHAVNRYDSSVPMVLLPLALLGQDLSFPHFTPLVERSASVLVVTEQERASVVSAHGRPGDVHRIGAPLRANPTSMSEPNPWVGDTDYILVRTDTACDGAGDPQYDLARMIRLRFPERPVGICHRDAFCAWHMGRCSTGWPIERSSDLARLAAWAALTVDLRPGPLFARECIDSLLYGTPIVVPRGSRALEHAQRGRGGLWFDSAGELMGCVDAMLDPDVHAALAARGRAYAEEEFGSTERFVTRVTAACGLGDGIGPVTP